MDTINQETDTQQNKADDSPKKRKGRDTSDRIHTIQHDDIYISTKRFSFLAGVHEKSVYKMLKDPSHTVRSTLIRNTSMISISSTQKYIYDHKKELPYKPKYKVISIFSTKGGVGKTSISFHLAIYLSSLGFKVLVNDFDMQASLTTRFKISDTRRKKTFLQVYEKSPYKNSIIEIFPTLHIVPSNITFGTIESRIDFTDGFSHFKDPIDKIKKDYDFIINDCPHSITKISFCAIYASDFVLMPVGPCELSKDALDQTITEVKKAQARGAEIDFKIVMNMFNLKEKESKKYARIYLDLYRKMRANSLIRRSTELSGATSRGQSIFEYNYAAPVCEDIKEITRLFLDENRKNNEMSKKIIQ